MISVLVAERMRLTWAYALGALVTWDGATDPGRIWTVIGRRYTEGPHARRIEYQLLCQDDSTSVVWWVDAQDIHPVPEQAPPA